MVFDLCGALGWNYFRLCALHSSDLQDSLGTTDLSGVPGGCEVLLAWIAGGAFAEAKLA